MELSNRMLGELRQLVADAEALLESGGERLDDTRDAVTARIRDARSRVRDLEDELAHRTRRTARRVHRYAQAHPWEVAGISLGIGLAAALVAWLVLVDTERD